MKKNKYTEHVRWVASFLYIDVPEDRLFEDHTKLRGRVFRHAVLRTLSEEQLRPYHERWYPASNGYVKRVPEDVVLDPVSLLHWFLDDGCAWRRRKESAKKQVIITFASESFTKEDQEHVVEKLKEIYGLPFRVKPYTQGTGWRIELSQGGVPEFYEIIGACPEPIKKVLGYKWK